MDYFFALQIRNRFSIYQPASIFAILMFVLVTAFPRQATAQARTTADRDDGVSAFATVSRIYTDYGEQDNGYAFGADYTRYMRLIAPSIEARYTRSTGSDITENSFAAGIKVERAVRRFHPYADFLIGYGAINFIGGPPAYNHDNSAIYNMGGGVDYRINRMFLVKLDVQQQYWKLGHADNELEPYNFSVGVVYRVPSGLARRR